MSDWVANTDAETGKTYYYNKKTKDTTWDLPPELVSKASGQPLQKSPPTSPTPIPIQIATPIPIQIPTPTIPKPTPIPTTSTTTTTKPPTSAPSSSTTTPPPPTGGKWNCQTCTFLNDSHYLICSMCNTPKTPKPETKDLCKVNIQTFLWTTHHIDTKSGTKQGTKEKQYRYELLFPIKEQYIITPENINFILHNFHKQNETCNLKVLNPKEWEFTHQKSSPQVFVTDKVKWESPVGYQQYRSSWFKYFFTEFHQTKRAQNKIRLSSEDWSFFNEKLAPKQREEWKRQELKDEEIKILFKYSGEWYRDLNVCLVHKDNVKLKKYESEMITLLHAVWYSFQKGLPDWVFRVMRLTPELESTYSIGFEFFWNTFTTTSRKCLDWEGSAVFAIHLPRGGRNTAVDMRAYSRFPYEDEILLSPWNKYRVIGVIQAKIKIIILTMEESDWSSGK